MSIAAYQQTIAECDDPRRIEYRVFLRVTLDLERHRDCDWHSAGFKEALWRNMELWNTLRADLLDEDNALPEQLRAGLISLSLSVDQHSQRILRGEADISLLIDINRAIMQGLQGLAPAPEVVHGS
jgi:flagellar protein FlaF